MAIQQQTQQSAPDAEPPPGDREWSPRTRASTRGRLIKTVEEAILKAAQSAFGPNRELEARFNDEGSRESTCSST